MRGGGRRRRGRRTAGPSTSSPAERGLEPVQPARPRLGRGGRRAASSALAVGLAVLAGRRRSVGRGRRRLASSSGPPGSIVASSERGGLPAASAPDGVEHGRVDQPGHRRVAGGARRSRRSAAQRAARASSVSAQLVDVGDPAVGVVRDAAADRHHQRGVDRPRGRRRHQREEGAGPAVGDGVAAARRVAERVHAEPVDARRAGDRRAATRDRGSVNGADSPGRELVDRVERARGR